MAYYQNKSSFWRATYSGRKLLKLQLKKYFFTAVLSETSLYFKKGFTKIAIFQNSSKWLLYCHPYLNESYWNSLNQNQPSGTFHTGTSRLFCIARQMIGFYMKCNTELRYVKLGRCSKGTPSRFWGFVLLNDFVILKDADSDFLICVYWFMHTST